MNDVKFSFLSVFSQVCCHLLFSKQSHDAVDASRILIVSSPDVIEHVVENVTGSGGEHELLDGAVVLDPNHNLLVTRMEKERVAHGPIMWLVLDTQ